MAITMRERADNIARRLGDSAGVRETTILADSNVRVAPSPHYSGCLVVSNGIDQFVYRPLDNTIVN